MEKNERGLSSLPLNTLQEIPTPNSNAQQIVALVKEEGRVTGYKLSDGRISPGKKEYSLRRKVASRESVLLPTEAQNI